MQNTKLFVPKEAEKEGITNPLTLLMAQPTTKPTKTFMIQKNELSHAPGVQRMKMAKKEREQATSPGDEPEDKVRVASACDTNHTNKDAPRTFCFHGESNNAPLVAPGGWN